MRQVPKVVGDCHEVEINSEVITDLPRVTMFATEAEAEAWQKQCISQGVASQHYEYRLVKVPVGWRSGRGEIALGVKGEVILGGLVYTDAEIVGLMDQDVTGWQFTAAQIAKAKERETEPVLKIVRGWTIEGVFQGPEALPDLLMAVQARLARVDA